MKNTTIDSSKSEKLTSLSKIKKFKSKNSRNFLDALLIQEYSLRGMKLVVL